MIVNGNEIAKELKRELSAKVPTFKTPPSLAIFYDEENTVGSIYVGRKESFGKEIGVVVTKIPIAPEETTDQLCERIAQKSKEVDGVLVQLPLPERFDTEKVLSSILSEVDVDLISIESQKFFEIGHTPLLPPVVGAIKILVDQYSVKLEGARAVVVGEGRLVGKPAAVWLRKKGAHVAVVSDPKIDLRPVVSGADIIVLGAGASNILSPDMIKDDVVIFDAGISILEGKVHGDANPSCAEKASVFTPTPGGLGPMAVATAFQNLLHLAEEVRRKSAYGKTGK